MARSTVRLLSVLAVLALPAVASAEVRVSYDTVTGELSAADFPPMGVDNAVTITVAGGNITVRDTAANPTTTDMPDCSASGDTVTCPVGVGTPYATVTFGDGNDTLTLSGIRGASVQGGDGNDTLNGGVLADAIQGDAGADTLNGGDGNDQLFGNADSDILDGGAGDDTIEGGDGADAMTDTGGGNDSVSYHSQITDPAGVVVTLDGAPNDGNPTQDADAHDNVGAGIDSVQGSSFADTLTGGPNADFLSGAEGDDTLNGGAGADSFNGADGNDRIEARDGAVDTDVDCDNSQGTHGAADVAVLDTDDPTPRNCETVDRGAGGGGGTGQTLPTLVTVTVPNVQPRGVRRFFTVDQLQDKLDKLGVKYRIRRIARRLGQIDAKYRPHVDDGDIVAQLSPPKPGSRQKIDTACRTTGVRCELLIVVRVYDEALELKSQRCPYRDPQKLVRAIDEKTYTDAVNILEGHDCNYRVVNYIEGRDAKQDEERIHGASVSKTANRFYVNLVVRRPRRSDFTVSVAPRPHSDYAANPGRVADFDKELDLGTDGKLTSSVKNQSVLHVLVNENATGRLVRKVSVEIVKNAGRTDAKLLASSETTSGGGVTFTFPTDWVGELEVSVRVTLDKRSEADLVEPTLHGWITVPVVARTGTFVTMSGKIFKRAGDSWARATIAPPSIDLRGMTSALSDLSRWANTAARACQSAAATDTNRARAMNTCWKDGVSLTETSSGGTSVGSGRAQIGTMPGLQVVSGGLQAVRTPVAVVPGGKAILGAAETGTAGAAELARGVSPLSLAPNTAVGGGGPLVGNGASTFLGRVRAITIVDAAGLIGANSGKIVSENGSGFISEHGGGLVSDGGLGLIPISTLIGQDGATR